MNKRFSIKEGSSVGLSSIYTDNGVVMTQLQVLEELNNLYDELDYWRKRALLLEKKYNEGNSIRWLRENTVWEQMPTKETTKTSTTIEDITDIIHTDEPTNSVDLKKEMYMEDYEKTQNDIKEDLDS